MGLSAIIGALIGSSGTSLEAIIRSLFASGQQGAWFDHSDIATLFQDSAGTTPVTAAAQPVGLRLDKSGRVNNSSQATAAARPTYQISPARITLDKVDDAMGMTVPTGGFVGTMILSTTQGTAAYGVNIPAGAYSIGGEGHPGPDIVGELYRHGALTDAEITNVSAYMVSKGGGPAGADAYAGVTNISYYWYEKNRITSFPLINTSAATNFQATWFGCSGVAIFPLIDVSAGTNFAYSWYNCTSLSSFPALNVSAGTNFAYSWYNCTSLSSFPALNLLAGTNFDSTWKNCTSLAVFPPNMFNTCMATDFLNAFVGCALTQTSVDNILISINTANTSNGTLNITGGTSAAPSAAGITAKNALIARGWVVTTNP